MTFNTPYIPHCPVPPLSLAATQNTLINQNRQLSWTEILINRWQSSQPASQSASKVVHYSYKARVLYENLMNLQNLLVSVFNSFDISFQNSTNFG